MNSTNDRPQSPSASTPTSTIISFEPQHADNNHNNDAAITSLDDNHHVIESSFGSFEEKEAEATATGYDVVDRYSKINLNNNITSISIETKTAPTVFDIKWMIDEESLDYACLKNKNKNKNNHDEEFVNDDMKDNQRGVLDATFTKSMCTFKLELCISGWKNSNRGYCAFYLTIPQIKVHGEVQPLTARYTVSIHNVSCSKQSSVRDDFHLGVGFPNFCTEEALTNSQKDNDNKLELNVKIEIFNTCSKIKQIETEIYEKFISTFGAIDGGSNSVDEYCDHLLMKMYEDKTFCDVVIRCKTNKGNIKLIECHKSILIHSSLVFQKMLSRSKNSDCSFVESRENEINLEDSLWTHFIIYHMIKFLYSGQISAGICQNVQYLFELFRVAEYYEITPLITECCNQFILTLDCETVCFLLLNLENKFEHVQQIQFMHQNNVLWRFIIRNIKTVKKTDYYQEILLTKPKIVNKLIEKMTS